jgi:formamidopyrimidine-DNA glycosylase
VPELPEVASLVSFLRERAVGREIIRVDIAAINALATYDPPVAALSGAIVSAAERYGKFLDIHTQGSAAGSGGSAGDLHLVIHLARAGWLHRREQLAPAPPKIGRGPIAARVHLGAAPAGSPPAGFDLTEAGTQKRLALYVVRTPKDVPGVARLGVEPLSAEFTVERLGSLLHELGGRQLKGVLRDQAVIAGIGNAYSDEVLHVARMSPFRAAGKLEPAEVATLHEAITSTLRDAIERAAGLGAAQLKAEKKINMRVHGRTGQPCPVCGDTVREVSFADSSLQYCPTCQTGGKPLADRRLSRLLK